MKLTIIGASGHGKVVANIARLSGYDIIEFLDDNPNMYVCGDYLVVGDSNKKVDGDVFVAIGNAKVRERLMSNRRVITLIHPSAIVAEDVVIGEGTVVMPGVVINPGSTIGCGCIINTSSTVDHDCIIGDFTHIAVGSHLCGTVNVGSYTWVGAGSTVVNNIDICSKCMIGAGSVVVKNINIPGTYVGVPAKLMEKTK